MKEIVQACPVCHSTDFADYLKVTDYFLTGEEFQLVECRQCTFRFINPRPSVSDILKYYQADTYISHNATKRDLLSTIYKAARRVNLAKKIRLIQRYGEIKSLLDIGCGTGEFLLHAKKRGIDVIGIEPTTPARNFAREVNGLRVEEKISELVIPEHSVDCITMWHVIEHVHDLDELFERIITWMKPSGVFIVAVPNCRSWDAKKFGKFWAAWDVPRHLYHFNSMTMGKLVERYGFKIIGEVPQKMDAFYVSLLSEKYRKSNLIYPRAFINGLRSNINGLVSGAGYSSQIYVLKR